MVIALSVPEYKEKGEDMYRLSLGPALILAGLAALAYGDDRKVESIRPRTALSACSTAGTWPAFPPG
jgi:hypothetical protein